MAGNVAPFIRFAFYAFIVSIPFESATLEAVPMVGTLPMVLGIVLTGSALLQPRICFSPPPVPFWCFTGYVFVYAILGATQDLVFAGPMLERLLTLIQLLLLMWISFNLFKHPEICESALMALVGSCAILSLVQISGIARMDMGQGRSSVFAEHANTLGSTLALGLIALVGITYGRTKVKRRTALLVWTLFPIIGTAIIMTGSRGSLVSLILGLVLLIVRVGGWGAKLKIGLVGVVAIGFLVWAAFTDEAMRTRLDHSMNQGDLARRDQIIPQAWDMFLEKPLLGWGPVYNRLELGSRFGTQSKDTHNLYLWVLTETGLLGSIPFFVGLWLSLKAAWKARFGPEGSLPTAMLVFLLIMNMGSTWHNRKLFWLILAYVLASAWFARKATRQISTQSLDSINVKAPSSGTLA